MMTTEHLDPALRVKIAQVKARRADLGAAIAALGHALDTPADDDSRWAQRLTAALGELAEDLREHLEATEGPMGVHDEVSAKSPRLAGMVRQLRADHRAFLDTVQRLVETPLAGAEAQTHQAQRDAAAVLKEQLGKHRALGAELIYQAYNVDIGGDG